MLVLDTQPLFLSRDVFIFYWRRWFPISFIFRWWWVDFIDVGGVIGEFWWWWWRVVANDDDVVVLLIIFVFIVVDVDVDVDGYSYEVIVIVVDDGCWYDKLQECTI